MRALVLWQGGLFAALVIGIAALAGARVGQVPVPAGDAPPGTWLDGSRARAFESHYDAVFPARNFGTGLWAALEYLVFGEGKAGVVVGQQGWLYTDEEFRTYAGADRALRTHLALIPWVEHELAAQGTRLVVALLPSKARLYREHLGRRQPASIHLPLYGTAHEFILAAGIDAPDLLGALTECKKMHPVFLRTDTHWTPEGARCVAGALSRGAPSGDAPRFVTRVDRVERAQGDLLKFLPLGPYFDRLLPPPESIAVRTTEPVDSAGADALLGDAPPPEVVLVGTSYSADPRWNLVGALREGLQEDVVSYAAPGQGPFVPMLQYLQDRQSRAAGPAPRLLIWEIPERYLVRPQDLRVQAAGGGAACAAPPPAAPVPSGAVNPGQLLQNHRRT